MLSHPIHILLLGSGGREHALAWAIQKSSLCKTLYISPGNAGTAEVGINIQLESSDHSSIAQFIKDKSIDMLVIGPEQPLVDGLRDYLALDSDLASLMIIGPGQLGAQLEGSKAWSKSFMQRHNIPTADYFVVDDIQDGVQKLRSMTAPYVLKADGLAAGKGVLIIDELSEAEQSLKEMLDGQFGDAGSTVVLESFLDGIEFSVFALTDGNHYILWPEAKDYKRAGDGDTGPNTGGMGSVSPVPFFSDELREKVIHQIIDPTIQGLKQDKIPYVGFIFFGLILVGDQPMVIEYNARMGDPETQVVVSRLDEDIVQMFYATSQGLGQTKIAKSLHQYAVNVVLASGGYPGSYTKGKEINLPATEELGRIFHAGTQNNSSLQTSGGRVLSAVAMGDDLQGTIDRAYELVSRIHFDGKYTRSDIGKDLL